MSWTICLEVSDNFTPKEQVSFAEFVTTAITPSLELGKSGFCLDICGNSIVEFYFDSPLPPSATYLLNKFREIPSKVSKSITGLYIIHGGDPPGSEFCANYDHKIVDRAKIEHIYTAESSSDLPDLPPKTPAKPSYTTLTRRHQPLTLELDRLVDHDNRKVKRVIDKGIVYFMLGRKIIGRTPTVERISKHDEIIGKNLCIAYYTTDTQFNKNGMILYLLVKPETGKSFTR